MSKRPVLIPALRKSSKEDPAISRDRQRRATEAWASANGVELGPEVWEPGVSGSKPWQERGLGQAIEACRRGEADGIIVEEQSRLSRGNGLQTAEMWDAFERSGIRLVCVNDGIDTATGDHELNFALRAAMAREQWKQYARRMEHSKRNAIARGVHISGKVPIGYRRPARGARLELDEAKAPAVRAAFELRARGATFGAVARMLDERLPGGPTGRGGWTMHTTKRVLENRVYLGEARHGELVNPAAHPAIVDARLFDTVQALSKRAERRVAPAETKSLLAGLVRCRGCGYAMDRQKMHGRDEVYIYTCRRRNAAGVCSAPSSIMLSNLDAFVEAAVLERIRSEKVERRSAEVELGEVHEAIAAARAKRAPFEDPDYVALLGKDAALRALGKVDAELDELDARLALLVGSSDADEVAVREAAEVWSTLTVAERREVIAAGLESVIVSRASSSRGPIADRVELVWVGEEPVGAPLPRRSRGHRPVVEAGLSAP